MKNTFLLDIAMFHLISSGIHNVLYGTLCIIGLYLFKNAILTRYGGKAYLSLWVLPIFTFLNPVSIKIGVHAPVLNDGLVRHTIPLYKTELTILCGIAWLVCGVLFIKYLYGKQTMKRRIFAVSSPASADEEALLAASKAALGITRHVEVRKTSAVHSPLIIRIQHPIIFLPDEAFTKEQLSLILQHELWHLKKRHVLYKELVNFVHILYWWNPATYNMLKNVSEATEFACDQLVLEAAPQERRLVYKSMIGGLVEKAGREYYYLAHFNGANGMLKRIKLMGVQQYKKRFLPTLLGILIIAGNMVTLRQIAPVAATHYEFDPYFQGEYEIVEQYGGLYDIYADGELVAHGVDDTFVEFLENSLRLE